MKIVFAYYGRYQVRDTQTIEYLSAIAKELGHETALVYDSGIFGSSDNVLYSPLLSKLFSNVEKSARNAVSLKPDMLVFSVNLNSYKWSCEVAKKVKEKLNVPVVFTGVHAACAKQEITKNGCVDFCIAGEPEAVFKEFISGVSFSEKALVNVNELPLPDKAIFEKHVNFSDSYLMNASRGCSYNCTYCEETAYNKFYKKNCYRQKGVGLVMYELIYMKTKYNYKEVIFKDSFFTQNKKWLKELMGLYKEKINVPFKCFGKIQHFDEQTARILKNGGCYCVEFGLQTWNEAIRRDVLNRHETNEQARKVFEICDKVGLKYDVDYMFGLPGETATDHILAAKEFACMQYLNRVKCHNLVYMPEMEITKIALEKGVISAEYAKSLLNGADADFFNTVREAENMRKINGNFRNFFKVINVLPYWIVETVLRNRLYGYFGMIPGFVVMFVQLLAGIIKSDLRFKVYLKHYPAKLKTAIGNSI